MENRMAEVAKMFGVELGERFRIFDWNNSDTSKFDFYFSNEGLMLDYEDGPVPAHGDLLELLKGNFIIKRKPWKPKDGDIYWYVCADGDLAVEEGWESAKEICGMNAYKLGNCYRTKEEAEANKDKWVKFYASDDVLEV